MSRLGERFVRFPHRCVIYYYDGFTGYETDEEISSAKVVVWEGRCRKESNTSVRTFKGTDNVLKTDYRLQLGSLVGGNLPGDADAAYDGRKGEECGAIVHGIKAGMLLDVTDGQDTFNGLTISDAYQGNLGTTVYFDDLKN